MELKTMVILALVIFGYYWYTNEDGARNIIESGIDKTNTLIELGQNTLQQCPDNFDPVCGNDGVTYRNLCFADKNGVSEYTLGECNET